MNTQGRAHGSLATLLVAMLTAVALALTFAASAFAQPVVPTERGLVQGTETPVLTKYLAMTYAAPPVGRLRLRPRPLAGRRTETLVAGHLAPHCPQPASPFGVASTPEDCLYLIDYT